MAGEPAARQTSGIIWVAEGRVGEDREWGPLRTIDKAGVTTIPNPQHFAPFSSNCQWLTSQAKLPAQRTSPALSEGPAWIITELLA